jgi:hypothetical protein
MEAAHMHGTLRHVTFRRLALPDDLVYEAIATEDLIQDRLSVKADVPVKVDINGSVFIEKFAENFYRFKKPLKI